MSRNSGVFARLTLAVAVMVNLIHAPVTLAAAPLTDNGTVVPDSFLASPTSLSSASAIQSFLDKKVLACEVSVCINNYSESGVSAASLIFNAASQNEINPEFLIVLIQSQVGIISDKTPSANQFSHASGFPCTDSDGNCLFSKQVNLAAKFFADAQSGLVVPRYQSGATYSLPFNINEACGSSDITMKNQATALLYSYNQNFNYQPNSSAISAEYGTGDNCSSYGIRNLHNYAYDWFIAPPPEPINSASTPVYRFWSPKNRHHFYTSSAQEKDLILSTYSSQIWTYEGVAFSAPIDNQCQQSSPVYRFWSNKNQGHFYTSSSEEKGFIISHYDENTWKYEGVAYCAYNISSSESVPVYRFWSNKNQGHFYTSSSEERDFIISHYDENTWKYEGIAYHATK